MMRQELLINELKNYMKWYDKTLETQDRQLSILNKGTDSYEGPVVGSVKSMNNLIMEPGGPIRDKLMGTAEKLFDKSFHFYNASLTLARQNKEAIVSKDAIKYYQQINVDLNDEIMIMKSETLVKNLD